MNTIPDYSILVCGVGSIGLRHIRNLHTLGARHIAAVDSDLKRLESASTDFGVKPFADYDEAISLVNPDIVLICTPPSMHVPQARRALLKDAHVFIEKPLSNSLADVDGLIGIAESKQRVVQVGYNLRYHPGVQKLKELIDDGEIGRPLWGRAEFGQYLPDWRPSQDYRLTYTARRELGGGVIFDLSHEIDYMMWILGDISEVTCTAGRISELQLDVEDTALISVRFESGALGEIHVDCVQREYTRTCKIVGELGTLHADLSSFNVSMFQSNFSLGLPSSPSRMNIAGTRVGGRYFQKNPEGEGSSVRGFESEMHADFDFNETYMDEMRDFLWNVEHQEQPESNLLSASRVLEVALAAHESSRERKSVSLGAQIAVNDPSIASTV